jgi:hypothetical protein
MKSVIWWSIGLLFGLAMVALNLFYKSTGDDIVLCGSERMQPGETCETTTYGQKSSETYEEKLQKSKDDQASYDAGGKWVQLGVEAGISALCGWRLVVAVRRRARQGSGAVAQTVTPGQQPGFAPPPGYPPQQQFPPQGYPVAQNYQPGYQQQPGFQQGFPPPQGFQQPPPPGYQPPNGPYQQ